MARVARRAPEDAAAPAWTLATLVERWSEDVMRHHVQESTLSNYLCVARHHLLPALGDAPIDEITVADVDHLLASARDQGLSPSTVRRVRTILGQCLDQAIRWGLLERNVAKLSRPPKAERSEGRTLTPDQARHLLEVARLHRNHALYALLLSTGLRRGEALGLRWSDFDPEAAVVRVARQLSRTSAGLVTLDTKTLRSRRAVNLAPRVVEALVEHEHRQDEMRRRARTWVETGFIFTTTRGTPIDPRNFYREFRALCDEAGLGHWHPHELRHSAASLMLAQGVKLHVVSRVLGHASIRMTSDVYGHLLEPDRREAADAMGALLWDGPTSSPESPASG